MVGSCCERRPIGMGDLQLTACGCRGSRRPGQAIATAEVATTKKNQTKVKLVYRRRGQRRRTQLSQSRLCNLKNTQNKARIQEYGEGELKCVTGVAQSLNRSRWRWRKHSSTNRPL